MSDERSASNRWFRRARRAAIGVGLGALAVLVAVAVLELALRGLGSQPDFFFQLDPEVGAVHIPNKRGWHRFAEGRQWIEINRHGYRDRDWTLDKPVGTWRLAVLGDSFVEGFQVPVDEHFLRRLEAPLAEACDVPETALETMNFGVSGFGTGQALETLRRRTLAFEPDIVLLAVYPSNDLFDNSREIDLEPNRLHFALTAEGALERLPYRVADHPVKRWLRHRSKAYLFVRDRVKRLDAVRRALIAARVMQQEKTRAERVAARHDARDLLDARYQVPMPPSIERAWALTEALVVAVRRQAEDAGTRFGVVVIPNREEVLGYHPKRPATADGLDYDQSLRRMSAICQRHAIRCLSLRDPLRTGSERIETTYFPIDGHWTAKGHAITADALAEWLPTWACPDRGADHLVPKMRSPASPRPGKI